MKKIKLEQAIVVEGKYDKLKLSNILDAFVVETNGFGIFKDRERMKFIKKLAVERGIILLTDSDHAGFMIRSFVSSGIPNDRVTNVYIPDVYGKEKRKFAPSKEGKLGVEGMSAEVLLAAFERAGVTARLKSAESGNEITPYDFYKLGLAGRENAVSKRKKLLKALDLPEFLSTSALISCINNMMSRDEFLKFAKKL